ncbi:hypothetical protein Sa4125_16610 [Aureimonas sp. SA4125]|uniref:hypothetical protein n=1 Tax=Aureimonas sp. SA4125 TaxID=2826993 RepID=UPI001CC6EF7A|nr:hypothetical protein [Aureimonas sp. SA4125]BDA84119.1 hypothetical protein Sa4125_16610 [Aureimonas sp. SA4125]
MADPQPRKPYQFQWGDRVSHSNFGLGTVNGVPVAVDGTDASPRFSVEDRGWRVPVEWDDPGRTPGLVSSDSIKMIERPDAKGGAYWNNEFQTLLAQLASARSRTDAYLGEAFRHSRGSQVAAIRELAEAEQQILAKVLQFLNVDETGRHA